MKRALEFLVLSLIGLLLSAAFAIAPFPIAEPAGSGMQQPHPIPAAAADKPGEGLVLTASPSPGLSRVDHPSLHGIAAEALVPAILASHRLALADISAISEHEIGFD